MKRLADAANAVPILSEVQPRDGITILEGDRETDDVRVEANRAVQSVTFRLTWATSNGRIMSFLAAASRHAEGLSSSL
jgi:hypothetical protein